MIEQVSPSQVKVTLDRVSALLDESGVRHVVHPAEKVIEARVETQEGPALLIVYVPDQPLAVTFALSVPVDAPLETMRARRSAMAEAISLANYTHPVGDFVMEPLTGHVFCRACVPLSDAVLTSRQFTETLQMIVGRADLMLPSFRAVVNDDVEPHVAMRSFLSPLAACGHGTGDDSPRARCESSSAVD
ncbi:MAG: YbjN domain-containing protein [Phycisphaerae bacterium]|jgi:hypothetical protein